MPIYLFQVVKKDGSRGEIIEVERSMQDPDPQEHPDTGEPLVRIYAPPNLTFRHTAGKTKRLLEDKNIEKAGFTKYVRDKMTGDYYKVVGSQGPDVICR
ncbi:MAG TPA: FmdB family transcriptional regulator [Opitutae bacterium]|nr:FmdB family transcriptional regulator [Opitutae bacterium]|tara:strand:- start:31 stop:327 length:297 start_codon:yes stop_codon:yes gene_type:complete